MMVENSPQAEEEGLEIDTLDPKDEENELRGESLEELEDLVLDSSRPDQVLHISNQLDPQGKVELSLCLKHNTDVFAWIHNDMKCLNPNIVVHRLNANPTFKPVREKRRTFTAQINQVVREEVQKLLKAGFIREVQYSTV